VNNPEEVESIIAFLPIRISVIDSSEVDRYKQSRRKMNQRRRRATRSSTFSTIRPHVLKQMGQVPLLTREQEVEISKRIEDAEMMVQKYLNRSVSSPANI